MAKKTRRRKPAKRNPIHPIPKCLGCDDKPAVSVGLCEPCRQAAQRMIRSGEATREQLEGLGLILPEQRGRKPNAWTKKAKEALAMLRGSLMPQSETQNPTLKDHGCLPSVG